MSAENKSPNSQEIVEKLRAAESLIHESLQLLGESPRATRSSRSTPRPARSGGSAIRFNLNERAFVKKYAKPLVGGPRKFVALLAYLANGNRGTAIDSKALKKLWNKTSAKDLLGMKYNAAFANRAKTEGWVNSAKRGVFNLEEPWREVFASE